MVWGIYLKPLFRIIRQHEAIAVLRRSAGRIVMTVDNSAKRVQVPQGTPKFMMMTQMQDDIHLILSLPETERIPWLLRHMPLRSSVEQKPLNIPSGREKVAKEFCAIADNASVPEAKIDHYLQQLQVHFCMLYGVRHMKKYRLGRRILDYLLTIREKEEANLSTSTATEEKKPSAMKYFVVRNAELRHGVRLLSDIYETGLNEEPTDTILLNRLYALISKWSDRIAEKQLLLTVLICHMANGRIDLVKLNEYKEASRMFTGIPLAISAIRQWQTDPDLFQQVMDHFPSIAINYYPYDDQWTKLCAAIEKFVLPISPQRAAACLSALIGWKPQDFTIMEDFQMVIDLFRKCGYEPILVDIYKKNLVCSCCKHKLLPPQGLSDGEFVTFTRLLGEFLEPYVQTLGGVMDDFNGNVDRTLHGGNFAAKGPHLIVCSHGLYSQTADLLVKLKTVTNAIRDQLQWFRSVLTVGSFNFVTEVGLNLSDEGDRVRFLRIYDPLNFVYLATTLPKLGPNTYVLCNDSMVEVRQKMSPELQELFLRWKKSRVLTAKAPYFKFRYPIDLEPVYNAETGGWHVPLYAGSFPLQAYWMCIRPKKK